MLVKWLAAVLVAGTLSVPLAGTAWADPPSNRGSDNGQGPRGSNNGHGLGPSVAPGTVIRDSAKLPGSVPTVVGNPPGTILFFLIHGPTDGTRRFR